VQLSILILASERLAAQSLAEPLTGAGHGVTVVARPEELASAAPGYGLVIIDRVSPPASVGEIVALLKGASGTAGLPVLGICQADTLDDRIKLLEAGVDDVLSRPFQPEELVARVEASALRMNRAPGDSGRRVIGDPQGRRMIAVFSPKGGAGTTTIATNLALLAAERLPNQVLLLDLDLSSGQVASHLNLQPKQTIIDLVRDSSALHEADLFRTYTVQLPNGMHVLAAPPTPNLAALLTTEHVDAVVASAAAAYEMVIVDAGTTMDDRETAVFGRADTVIVPVLPEVPALHSVRVLLDETSETGWLGSHTVFVLNNAFARDLLKRPDIEAALGAKISLELPYDASVYLRAANEGTPVITGSPKSPPAVALRALGDLVLGGGASADAGKKEKKGLFGRR